MDRKKILFFFFILSLGERRGWGRWGEVKLEKLKLESITICLRAQMSVAAFETNSIHFHFLYHCQVN